MVDSSRAALDGPPDDTGMGTMAAASTAGDGSTASPPPTSGSADVRSAALRMVVAIALLFGYLGTVGLLIDSRIREFEGNAAVIDEAGRQRMWSQRATAQALIVLDEGGDEETEAARRGLFEAFDQLSTWETRFEDLRTGTRNTLDRPETPLIGPNTGALLDLLRPLATGNDETAAPPDGATIATLADLALVELNDVVLDLETQAVVAARDLSTSFRLWALGAMVLSVFTLGVVVWPAVVRARAAVAAVESINRRYDAMIQTAPIGIMATGADGTVVTSNQAARLLLAPTAGPNEGGTADLSELLDDDSARELADVLATGSVQPVKARLHDGPAAGATVKIHGIRVDDAALRTTIDWTVVEDVTNEERMIAELEDLADRLAESNENLDQFASVAAHDLRAPVRRISALCSVLTRSRDDLSEESNAVLDRLVASADRMQELIDALLTFSRVTSRREPPESIALGDVVSDAIADLGADIDETGARIEVEPLPMVWANRHQMRQLFQNVIANAIKFHRPGTHPTIRVSAEPGSDDTCVVTVSDDGIGFEPDQAERIFGVFQRLHGHAEYEGTGVGLATCRKIAERNAGSITARSTPGNGASFVVTLRRAGPLSAVHGD